MEKYQFPILHGKSKDSVILLSIPEPVCSKIHLFANIISQFKTWPINSKQRNNAAKMIKEYLSEVTVKSLFLLSRKNEKETYDRRYHETLSIGKEASINMAQYYFQLRQQSIRLL
jgi:hypothetical protein